MREHRRASLLGLIVGGCLVATLPFMVGQGCATTTSVPGNGIVDSIPGGLPGDGSNGNNGNGGGPAGVTFRFTAPTGDVQAEVGDRITVVWTDSAPAGSTAVIALLLVPAPGSNNGNTVPVALNIPINDPANYYIIDTGLLNLSPGSYRITARISDGTSETTATVPGWLNLGEYGSRIKPLPPTVVVTEPQQNLSTSQGSGFDVNYCQHNRSGGEAPQVLIMLDNNRDPLDDIFADISGDNVAIADRISKICSSPMPVVVDGGVVVGCQKGVDCTNPAAGTPFTISADVMSRIPKQPNGEPYNVRVSVWDHINPPVHAYAAGTISVTSMATGTVPLEKVGKTLAGAKFMGGDTGGWLGSTGT
ncbi:MAG: hypothetical protein FWC56_00675, partial [Phycisphaerae bacterium]|nr:hypothetical protein [Phycisphaerae bacterium]